MRLNESLLLATFQPTFIFSLNHMVTGENVKLVNHYPDLLLLLSGRAFRVSVDQYVTKGETLKLRFGKLKAVTMHLSDLTTDALYSRKKQ